jgi:hypothetical protein
MTGRIDGKDFFLKFLLDFNGQMIFEFQRLFEVQNFCTFWNIILNSRELLKISKTKFKLLKNGFEF